MVVIDKHEFQTQEEKRLKEDRDRTRYWKHWGPYVAERQWATGSSSYLGIRDDLTLPTNYAPQYVRIIRKLNSTHQLSHDLSRSNW